MADLDSLFGLHAASLQLQRSRMDVLASNIANADTPGYKARDIDFNRVMAEIKNQASALTPSLSSTNPAHLGANGADATSDVERAMQSASVYRVPTQPSADGNTVDVQVEQAQFADAALHYQASLSFIDHRLRSLMTAITGQ